MKAFKTSSAARIAACGGPVVRVGDLYIAAPELDIVSFGLTSVELIAPTGHVTAGVTLKHLERLGNANYAQARPGYGYNSPSKVFTPSSENPLLPSNP